MRFLVIFIFSFYLFADVDATIRIEKDVESRSRVAIIDGSVGVSPNINSKFFEILLADLKISGHFLADKTHYMGRGADFSSKDYIIKYKFSIEDSASLNIQLIEVSSDKQIMSKNYNIPSFSKYPFLVHQAVSDINQFLKYPSISWINRYLVFSRYTSKKQSEIILSDYTMNYRKVIISGGLNLFPKWADKNQRTLYYTSYNSLIPTLYKLNIYNGSKIKIASSEGMLVCSDVKGSKILVTMAPNGQPDIYEIDTLSGVKNRLTSFSGIDVKGRYVDGGDSMIFISNPLGYANVYKKSLYGTSVSQLVYHGKNNNSCDAYGKSIVYSSRETKSGYSKNRFNIYLASSNGYNTKPLTSTGSNQLPTFSSDGSVVLYVKSRGNSSSIGYINLKDLKTVQFPLSGRKIQSLDW